MKILKWIQVKWYQNHIKKIKMQRTLQMGQILESSVHHEPLKISSSSSSPIKMSQKMIILKLFQDHLNEIVSREQIFEKLGMQVGDWRRNISSLRDDGYVIWGCHDHESLSRGQYILKYHEKINDHHTVRKKPTVEVQEKVREIYNNACHICKLKEGEMERGRRIKLVFDHAVPFSHHTHPADPSNPEDWILLCIRHNNQKKSFWDDKNGKPNLLHLVQNAREDEKKILFEYLKNYYGSL